MSEDPRTLIECPCCKGEGFFPADPCPYPPDTEVDCKNCSQENSCGKAEVCDCCDGDGQIPERDYKTIVKNIEQ